MNTKNNIITDEKDSNKSLVEMKKCYGDHLIRTSSLVTYFPSINEQHPCEVRIKWFCKSHLKDFTEVEYGYFIEDGYDIYRKEKLQRLIYVNCFTRDEYKLLMDYLKEKYGLDLYYIPMYLPLNEESFIYVPPRSYGYDILYLYKKPEYSLPFEVFGQFTSMESIEINPHLKEWLLFE